MPIEQRVVSSSKSKVKGGGNIAAPAADGDGPATGGGKKGTSKLVIVLVVAVVLLNMAGMGFLFMKMSAGTAAPAPTETAVEAEHEPGEVVADDKGSLSINLARGHFLRIGFSLQMSADAGEHVDFAEARDAAITLYSGREMDEVNSAEGRAALKEALVTELNARYGEGTVLDVYLTEYVTQ